MNTTALSQKLTGNIDELEKILADFHEVNVKELCDSISKMSAAIKKADKSLAVEFLNAIKENKNELLAAIKVNSQADEEDDDEPIVYCNEIDTGIGKIEYNASSLLDIQVMEELERLLNYYGSNKVLNLLQNTPLTPSMSKSLQ